jgi:S1-C subfamily serine protease
MLVNRSGIGKSIYVLSILLIIITSSSLYYNFVINQDSKLQELQKSIALLQSRNRELEKELAGNSQASTSILSIDPVKVYNSTNRSVVIIQGERITVINTFFGLAKSIETVIGSGFMIDYLNSSYVATNFHVVNGIVNATVTFWDGNAYKAKVIGTDPYSDLAIISVEAPITEFYPLKMVPSSSLKVGQPVVAIGNPFGLSGSMTFGIISQLGRTIREGSTSGFAIADIIQFSAPINPGNSGGPLLNADGMVIGITTAIVSGSQGVGFAIPSNTLIRELPFLIRTGRYDLHPYLGIGGVDMNYQLSQVMKSNATYGVLIANVVDGGPADKAGLRAGNKVVQISGQQYIIGGDIIVSMNGTKIVNQDALSTYLQERTIAGQTVHVGVIRDGNLIVMPIILGARPPPQV